MSSRTVFINVLPNPFCALDDQGNPAGVCPVDGTVNTRQEFIGATKKEIETIDNFKEGDLRSPRTYIGWEFTSTPVTVEKTPYYDEKVRSGELFVADLETANLYGIGFSSYDGLLARAATEAAEKWKAAYGRYPRWYTPLPVEEAPAAPPESSEEKVAQGLLVTEEQAGQAVEGTRSTLVEEGPGPAETSIGSASFAGVEFPAEQPAQPSNTGKGRKGK